MITVTSGPAARGQEFTEGDDEDPALEEDPQAAETTRILASDDPNFGPALVIERIEIRGNSSTAEKLIRRVLLVRAGESLRAGDPRLRNSRFRVLALGYFADVRLELRRGSARGKVVLTVEVVERGTITLHRLYLGTSEATPVWLGLDVSEANLFGTGIGVGAAVVWADAARVQDGESQYALRLRYGDPSVFGLPLGVHAAFSLHDASEPYRIAGALDEGDPDHFAAFGYSRVGGTGGVSLDVTRLSRVVLDARFESVEGDPPAGAAGFIEPGRSEIVTVALGFERDTRADPVLPYGGDRARVAAEYGDTWMGGADYRYLRLGARYENWKALRGARHVVSAHLSGGAIFGDAPGFDRFYVGDWNRLLAPRPLDLVVSTRPTPDFLGASADPPVYGDLAAAFELEYSYRLFRRTRRIYGGDLFVGVGVFGLVSRRSAGGTPDGGRIVDLTFDAGLRLDTEIGIFELSLANGLGRIPF